MLISTMSTAPSTGTGSVHVPVYFVRILLLAYNSKAVNTIIITFNNR